MDLRLSLFEPDAPESLRLMAYHAKRFDAFSAQAQMWADCQCPGAEAIALRQASDSFRAWLVFALALDLEAEAGK